LLQAILLADTTALRGAVIMATFNAEAANSEAAGTRNVRVALLAGDFLGAGCASGPSPRSRRSTTTTDRMLTPIRRLLLGARYDVPLPRAAMMGSQSSFAGISISPFATS